MPALRQPTASSIRVLVGEAFGRRSPVATFSRLAYVDVEMEAGASIELPDDVAERGAYVVEGEVTCGAERCARWHMLRLPARAPRAPARRDARAASCCSPAIVSPSRVTSGGTSSPAREARIEQAKRDWRERRGAPDGPFPLVPGDEHEFIPLPEG